MTTTLLQWNKWKRWFGSLFKDFHWLHCRLRLLTFIVNKAVQRLCIAMQGKEEQEPCWRLISLRKGTWLLTPLNGYERRGGALAALTNKSKALKTGPNTYWTCEFSRCSTIISIIIEFLTKFPLLSGICVPTSLYFEKIAKNFVVDEKAVLYKVCYFGKLVFLVYWLFGWQFYNSAIIECFLVWLSSVA